MLRASGVSDSTRSAGNLLVSCAAEILKTATIGGTDADDFGTVSALWLSSDCRTPSPGRLAGGEAPRCSGCVVRRGGGAPPPRRKRHRQGVSTGLPTKATHKCHVWTWDFIADTTVRGGVLRMLTILDEYTRECHVLRAERALRAADVLEWLQKIGRAHV